MSKSEVNNYFVTDANTGYHSVVTDRIHNQVQQKEARQQAFEMGSKSIAKSFGNDAMIAGVGIAGAGLGYLAFKVSAFVIGLLTLPLIIIPPVWALVATVGGLVVGGAVAMGTVKLWGSHFIDNAKDHWKHAMHLYDQYKLINQLQFA